MSILINKSFYIFIFCTLISCTDTEQIVAKCNTGYNMASDGKYDEAIPLLSSCIESSKATLDEKRYAYLARAWIHFNHRDVTSAVADQESAFHIRQPSEYRELINYALYLRLSGRVSDSLTPLKQAEEMDRAEGKVSMMTQYHLGWTLQELGQHREAVEAFSHGIPDQPDYAFVYLRRGISLDALGRKTEARDDLSKGLALAKQNNDDLSSKELTPLRNKLVEYDLL